MAITGGMAYIVLFAVFRSIWLVTNCQEQTNITGIVLLAGADNWLEQKVTLIRMEEPTKEASPMEWIETLKKSNKFEVHRMKEQLRTKIDSLKLLPYYEIRNRFAEIIQEAFYEDIAKEHSDWIVIPWGFAQFSTNDHFFTQAHIDLPRDADIGTLLQQYGFLSCDFMELLAKNKHVKAATLAHYNGNVEQYAMEMLTLDYTMTIWIPTEPVQAWPLAFTPAYQCDETRTITHSPDMDDPHQYLLKSESTSNDWYTRWNMQTDELYVWDSRKVAHAAVKIGDGEGKRSSIAMRLLIVHPKKDRFPTISSPQKNGTLCYTERLFLQVSDLYLLDSSISKKLAEMGYDRLCEDPPTALLHSPSKC